MHQATMQEIVKSVNQILFNQQQTLEELTNSGAYKKNSNEVKTLQRNIEVFKNEAEKVESLEMTIAVIGTMKAGKSTTINAIVGQEVLPNRTMPMTTLPTLIRHKKGQKEPVLKFSNIEPTNSLLAQVGSGLNPKLTENESNFKSKETYDLAVAILNKNGPKYHTEYVGQLNINEFLKSLNELYRLAGELNINPPYSAYEKLSELPIIEVEFYHLAKSDESMGTLSILDTPGPNEFGQSDDLKEVFRTQLKQASAVLLVTDYTQLGGDSTERVNAEVREIREQYDGRLHVLVNKFDNADGSMPYEETKRHVASKIIGNGFSEDDVYPISSRDAFLANYALSTLERNESLNPELELVQQFGEKGLHPRRWKQDIGSNDEVIEGANYLWKESQFQVPIDNVVRESYSKAAFQSLKAALAKVSDQGSNQCSLLDVRLKSYDINLEKLKQLIDDVETDIGNIYDVKAQVEGIIQSVITTFETQVKKTQTDKLRELTISVNELFSIGKEQEKQSKEAKLAAEKSEKSEKRMAKLRKIFGIAEEGFTPLQFDPNDPKIEFDDKPEAEKYFKLVNKAIIEPFDTYTKELKGFANNLPKDVATQVEVQIDKTCGELLAQAQKTLGDKGINIKPKLTKIDVSELKINSDSVFGEGVNEEKIKVHKSRQESGAWNTFKSWFGQEDYESYTVEEERFVVDMSKIQAQVKSEIKRIDSQLQVINSIYIVEKIKPSIDEKIDQVSDYLESFRLELCGGLSDQKKSKNELNELKSKLTHIKISLEDNYEDAKDVLVDLND